MVKEIKWCVLGGWGVEVEVLKPLFGDFSIYLDINPLMKKIVKEGKLNTNWIDLCCEKILSLINPVEFIAGWSTGTLIIMACASKLKPKGLVLISATPSFCRNSIFKMGIKPIILQKMREKLLLNPKEVISEFRKNCGFEEENIGEIQWSKDELISGLHFLEEVIILEEKLYCSPLFIHGSKDEIVPFSAGEYLHNKYGGCFLSLDAPHACFLNNEEKITKQIEYYLKGLQI